MVAVASGLLGIGGAVHTARAQAPTVLWACYVPLTGTVYRIRTTNTKEAISRERAHVHFELDLVASDRFPEWYRRTFPSQRNDHGAWNGQNLIGLDPRLLLLAQQKQGAKFSLADFIRDETGLCRVVIRDPQFAWARRFPMLVKPNPLAQKEGVAGYELGLNFNGLPYCEYHSRLAYQPVSDRRRERDTHY